MRNLICLLGTLLLYSCQPSFVRPIVYEPKKTDDIMPYYVDGNPVAAITSEDALMQLAVSYSEISLKKYARLWVNYTNLTDAPVLLSPMSSFELTEYIINKKSEHRHPPVFPSLIIDGIQKSKESVLLVNAFIGILDAATSTATTYYSSNGTIIRKNDLNEKLRNINANTANRAENLKQNYDYLIQDINSLFLRKNTVFPNQSVSGFVYFELEKTMETVYKPRNHAFSLNLNCPGLSHTIQFLPVEGD